MGRHHRIAAPGFRPYWPDDRLKHQTRRQIPPQTSERPLQSRSRQLPLATAQQAPCGRREDPARLRPPVPLHPLPHRAGARRPRDQYPGSQTAKGTTAWLVEDHTVPIIAIPFVFDGGTAQEPGRQGRPRQFNDRPVRRGRGRSRQRRLPGQARQCLPRHELRRATRRHQWVDAHAFRTTGCCYRSAKARGQQTALRPGGGRPRPRPDFLRHHRQ